LFSFCLFSPAPGSAPDFTFFLLGSLGGGTLHGVGWANCTGLFSKGLPTWVRFPFRLAGPLSFGFSGAWGKGGAFIWPFRVWRSQLVLSEFRFMVMFLFVSFCFPSLLLTGQRWGRQGAEAKHRNAHHFHIWSLFGNFVRQN
jgi:hypothetical protein